jgi:hypothetical protein
MQVMDDGIVISKNDKLADIALLAKSEKYQSIMSQVRAGLCQS